MVERRNGASLLRETRSMLASEPSYGNDSIRPEIAGLPYFAHASLADELKNFTTQARIRVLGVEDTRRIVYSYRAVGMRQP